MELTTMCTVIYLVFERGYYHRAFTTYEKAEAYIEAQHHRELFEIYSEEPDQY
jgi:hypothetical protein